MLICFVNGISGDASPCEKKCRTNDLLWFYASLCCRFLCKSERSEKSFTVIINRTDILSVKDSLLTNYLMTCFMVFTVPSASFILAMKIPLCGDCTLRPLMSIYSISTTSLSVLRMLLMPVVMFPSASMLTSGEKYLVPLSSRKLCTPAFFASLL